MIFECNNFTCKDNHYIQLAGMAMGTPCAPTVCTLTFYVYERLFLKQNREIGFWIRHVDDILAGYTGSKRQLEKCLDKSKKGHPDFSYKIEFSQDKATFCDVEVRRDQTGQLSTYVYRHPAKVPVFMHYDSCQPLSTKRAIVRSSCIRFRRICSSISGYDKECMLLSKALISRGYPYKCIHQIILDVRKLDRDQLLNRANNNVDTSNISKIFKPRLILTHIPGVSNQVRTCVNKQWKKLNNIFDYSLQCSYSNYANLGDILNKKFRLTSKFPYSWITSTSEVSPYDINTVSNEHIHCAKTRCVSCKDHLVLNRSQPIAVQNMELYQPVKFNCSSSNLIYIMFCNKCPGNYYIGETGNSISVRIGGHRSGSSDLYKHVAENHLHEGEDPGTARSLLPCLKFSVLSSTYNKSRMYRRGREYFYLRALKPPLNPDLNPP